MTTQDKTLNAVRVWPGWVFWILWYAATFFGAIAYAVPVSVVHFILGLDRLEDPALAAQLPKATQALAAVVCGAACGSTIGLAQWLVLRKRFKHIGQWVAATMIGYASIGLLPLIGDALQSGWSTWAWQLIISGKMHWLARVVADWPASSWLPGAITLTLFGGVLGAVQWFVLLGRVRQAGWWILISLGGWALGAILSAWPSNLIAVLASFDVPVVITGAGMVWLLRRSRTSVQALDITPSPGI